MQICGIPVAPVETAPVDNGKAVELDKPGLQNKKKIHYYKTVSANLRVKQTEK